MIVKKRRRAVTSPIERANQKSDEDFVADYLKPGSPHTLPWTTRWTHPRTGVTYGLSLARSAQVGELALETCFGLIEETSRGDYDASVQKWRPSDKRREMREADLRYIIVRREGGEEDEDEDKEREEDEEHEEQEAENGDEQEDRGTKRRRPNGKEAAENENQPDSKNGENGQNGQNGDMGDISRDEANCEQDEKQGSATPTDRSIRGFTSLMPTYEEGQPVVYCYEIHLKPELKGTGLGALLLGFLSTVAYNLPPISKVMLTCFLSNERARRFYQKQGFARDAVSPETRTLRGGKTCVPDYTILSKTVSR